MFSPELFLVDSSASSSKTLLFDWLLILISFFTLVITLFIVIIIKIVIVKLVFIRIVKYDFYFLCVWRYMECLGIIIEFIGIEIVISIICTLHITCQVVLVIVILIKINVLVIIVIVINIAPVLIILCSLFYIGYDRTFAASF